MDPPGLEHRTARTGSRRRARTCGRLVQLGVLLALGGCGATQTVTVTSVRTVTQTVAHRSPTGGAHRATRSASGAAARAYASTYPRELTSRLHTRCVQGGNGPSYCTCVLHYVEQHVPVYLLAADPGVVYAANPPSWLQNARDTCFQP